MMDKRRQDIEKEEMAPDLPPESAAAHFEAIGKAIGDIDVIVRGLLERTPPTKPWQRQLRMHLQDADRHVEILRLAISLEHDLTEIHDSARKLKQVIETANVQVVGGRADGITRNALMVAYRNASLLSCLLAP
ncbi:hypothetical protein [Pelomonas aquatica]|jgi:hypothetical protein|uniref:Uncharacterized protein n=4 Tax=Pseudomonadota TaxID=1224 RepID=A0A9X4LFI9_9BURK|nr:hypothetical protein [Burkholderiaceae bacterium]MCY4754364.1 hypothetical protein [Pelomonas aquatica]MDG0861587.1 hypothetical protein [Pelomonas aquatica]RTL17592.1 MAG: hypothetical protein EKK52_16245 [Burkholderiales bacterium]|mmetsp:Transcript_12860/g.30178  ORF Transcript_12860/g.30178 Transcript_12860/m.30178 type:complete len:133 (+) Transcript_12860:915-1313(+)